MVAAKYSISELHVGKFTDSNDFQCWRVSFRTEVCANTTFLQLAMSWIKEVVMAKSMDDLMTSQSNEGNIFLLLTCDERRAQNMTDFLRGRQLPCMIFDPLQATGASDVAQGRSDLFNICLHSDDVQDFHTRWDQLLLATSEIPQENVLEGLYKMKLRGSVQVQTALAMHDQEIDGDRVMPSYQRLRTVIGQHVDQMIRTRNFKVQNERIETGVVVKSHKGRKGSVERKVGCYQWKATGQCPKGTLAVATMGSIVGNTTQSSSSTSRAPTQTDGRKPYKNNSPRGESPSRLTGKRACKNFFEGKVHGTAV